MGDKVPWRSGLRVKVRVKVRVRARVRARASGRVGVPRAGASAAARALTLRHVPA